MPVYGLFNTDDLHPSPPPRAQALDPSEEVFASGAAARAAAKRWHLSAVAIAKAHAEGLTSLMSRPVALIVRWLEAVRMCRNISLAVYSSTRTGSGGDREAADSMFNALAQAIGSSETESMGLQQVVEYMIVQQKMGSQQAHALLRTLDADHDGMITRSEWCKGWEEGVLADVYQPSPWLAAAESMSSWCHASGLASASQPSSLSPAMKDSPLADHEQGGGAHHGSKYLVKSRSSSKVQPDRAGVGSSLQNQEGASSRIETPSLD